MRSCDAPMVKGVTTVVKLTVLYTKSAFVVWFIAECCAVLLAVRKFTRSSSLLSARSRRSPTAGGGSP